jgi:hypothetical protein
MSRNGTWTVSTCLAIGATAFALGVVSTPTFAAGREGGGNSVGHFARGGGEESRAFVPAMAHANFVSVPASSFIDPTGMRSAASAIRQPSAAATQGVVRDPILARAANSGSSARDASPVSRPSTAATQGVVRDPILPRASDGGSSARDASAVSGPSTAATQGVVRDPILPQASTEPR